MRRALFAATVAALAGAAPAASAATVEVTVGNGNRFTPDKVQVAPGDAVSWRWTETNHSVTSTSGESFDSDPGVAPFLLNHPVGSTFAHTFTAPGTSTYVCTLHANMIGKVVVAAPGSGPPADTVAPKISSLKIDGEKARFKLDEAGAIKGSIFKRFSARNAKALKTFKAKGKQGKNVIKLPVSGLDGGKYSLTLKATDAAGNRSKSATKSFSVRASD